MASTLPRGVEPDGTKGAEPGPAQEPILYVVHVIVCGGGGTETAGAAPSHTERRPSGTRPMRRCLRRGAELIPVVEPTGKLVLPNRGLYVPRWNLVSLALTSLITTASGSGSRLCWSLYLSRLSQSHSCR